MCAGAGGKSHIEEMDLSAHRFAAGDARLVEDATDRGHTTRTTGTVPGGEPSITAVIPLA